MDYLDQLESESIFILREVAGQFSNPALLFSGGKDSITLVHLSIKAFFPLQVPFTLVHIDTGHNFKEALEFRDYLVKKHGLRLVVRQVEDTIKRKNIPDATGKLPSRNTHQTYTLLETISEFGFDCCIGGARRDEEKARAKERIFSFRGKDNMWKPQLQRPEVWDILNGRIHEGENVRAFPLSNWTERDVWEYIQRHTIELPSLYFAHEREVFKLNGRWVANSPFVKLDSNDQLETRKVRFRTVGDMTCTAAIESEASTVQEVLNELYQTELSERGQTRLDDHISETGMEDRKVQGYF
ncbi:MAG: sulfate adenylyltransferase subunit 2 [Bacteroidia bacterium]|nr:sulfate adenylyltransferase subunit 2 [Bacteroidia bacterium]